MNRSLDRRLSALESARLESDIARLRRHLESISREELELIIEIADGQRTGIWTREYTPAEVEAFERHCAFMATIPDSTHDENTRRGLAELLADGRMTRAEVIQEFGAKYL